MGRGNRASSPAPEKKAKADSAPIDEKRPEEAKAPLAAKKKEAPPGKIGLCLMVFVGIAMIAYSLFLFVELAPDLLPYALVGLLVGGVGVATLFLHVPSKPSTKTPT